MKEDDTVLIHDCIVEPFGRMSAGDPIAEAMVQPDTWQWLKRNGYVAKISELEVAAEEAETKSQEPEAKPETKKRTTSRTRKPASKKKTAAANTETAEADSSEATDSPQEGDEQ